MRIACGAENEQDLTTKHFGDSNYFLVYEITEQESKLVKKIKNTSPEEKQHGDPEKAKAIQKAMEQEGVKALVAYAMGPNIVRMRKHFVPIISRNKSIKKTLEKLRDRVKEIKSQDTKREKSVVYID